MKKSKLKNLSIFIDGASRGNPGPAGIGIVINDNISSENIDNLSKYIGNTTNNVAEYSALLYGMEKAVELGANDITINTDSELLAKQLGGEYKVKSPALKDLYNKALSMLKDFEEVRVNNIRREDNKEADKLANKAIDNADKNKRVGKSFILKAKKGIKDTIQESLF